MAMQELPEELNKKVKELMDEAYKLSYYNKESKATEKYKEAFALIPEPKNNWVYASVSAHNIASYYNHQAMYKAKNEEQKRALLEEALVWYKVVMSVPYNIGIGFNHLRIGQVRYELGDFEKAKDEFMRVYMADGEEGFSDDDPKYFELIKPIIDKK